MRRKRILITGGAQGIGRQLVQRFHDDGAIVFTIDKDKATIEQLKKDLPNVTAVQMDLADWDGTRKTIESFGALDHVVNNAGVVIPQAFMDVTKEMANLHFDVNVLACFNVIQTAAKGMIEQGTGGTIVNISSICSSPNLNSAAVELAAHNIRTNCIAPGLVDTPMARIEDPVLQTNIQKLISRCPIKRTIDTNEIVDLVMFVLSPLASMITGETTVIDGGVGKRLVQRFNEGGAIILALDKNAETIELLTKEHFEVNTLASINIVQSAARGMIRRLIDSPMAKLNNPTVQQMVERFMQETVIKRPIDPNEIADLVLFLLSPLSAMITGENILIDGGRMCGVN
ncbi:L-xylulose reductase [Orchesella cincta]|uniref:L-xylulose reductase n=1 Tax=Orchesella cincta TaxID=48709 RepID=A0A1D2MK79_ORCCI|nr:L-xylulose reductase [Orchesella cincta]